MNDLISSAFGNKNRIKLLVCLSDGHKTVSELIQTCGISQSAVSQHLSKLAKSSVVLREKRGREVYYSLKDIEFGEVGKKILELERNIQ